MIARSVLVSALLLPALAAADGLGPDSIKTGDTTFPAIVAGDGPPVVFVHGLLADARAWAGLKDATTAGGHRFVAYTQRGFGPGASADAPFSRDRHTDDLLAILGTMDTPVDLVGWSYAGAVVLRAAAAAPDRVRRVVVYEPYVPELIVGGTPEQQAAAAAMTAAMGPVAAAMEAGDTGAAARAAIESLFGLGEGGFASEPADLQAIQLDNAASFASWFAAAEPTAITCEELGTIQAPTLVVAGSTTLSAFAEMSKAVAACIPGAKSATMDGQGHGGPIYDPAAFADLTLGFIDAP